jgi:hypothetical protein
MLVFSLKFNRQWTAQIYKPTYCHLMLNEWTIFFFFLNYCAHMPIPFFCAFSPSFPLNNSTKYYSKEREEQMREWFELNLCATALRRDNFLSLPTFLLCIDLQTHSNVCTCIVCWTNSCNVDLYVEKRTKRL